MSTKNVFILIIFNCILFTFSCQSDQQASSSFSTDDYIPNIYSRYLSMEKEYKIEVTFTKRSDSKFKNQAVGGDLYFRGRKLNAAETRYGGVMYMIQLPQETYTSSKVIEWRQGDKVLERYESLMEPLYDFSIPNSTIEKEKGFRLNWDGTPLLKDEFLKISINPEFGDPLKMNRLGPTDNPYTSIVPQQLGKLKPGSCQVSIIKNKRANIRDDAGNLKCLFFDEYHMPDLQCLIK